MLKLFLLGPVRIEYRGNAVYLQRRHATALLAYLAATRQPHERIALATLLWPNRDNAHALESLRVALHELTMRLGRAFFVINNDMVGLNLSANCWIDLYHFETLANSAFKHTHLPAEAYLPSLQQLAEAAPLHRSDLLAGFSLRDVMPFNDWLRQERRRLRAMLRQVLQRLTCGYCALREYEQALSFAEQQWRLDLCHEITIHQLVWFYAMLNNRAEAIRLYRDSVGRLQEELGVEPPWETTQLVQQIQKGTFRPFNYSGEAAALLGGSTFASSAMPLCGACLLAKREE